MDLIKNNLISPEWRLSMNMIDEDVNISASEKGFDLCYHFSKNEAFDILLFVEFLSNHEKYDYHVFHLLFDKNKKESALYSQLHFYTKSLPELLSILDNHKLTIDRASYTKEIEKIKNTDCKILFEDSDFKFYEIN